MTCPLVFSSTAQKSSLGHDTVMNSSSERGSGPITAGLLQRAPSKAIAHPASMPTALQKVDDGHDTSFNHK